MNTHMQTQMSEIVEHLEKMILDEQYNLDETKPEQYSYKAGWNTALKRACILFRAFFIWKR